MGDKVLRDEKGRILPGSAPLNPTGNVEVRKRHQHYLELMEEAITDEDIKEIVRTAVADAKGGDRWARQFVFEYLVGKPTVVPGGPKKGAPVINLIQAWIAKDLRDNPGADPLMAQLIEGEVE